MKKQLVLGIIAAMAFAPPLVFPFPQGGCGPESCVECHSLTKDEASERLGNLVDGVVSVNSSPVKGLWEIIVQKGGKKVPIYMDFSGSYLISGDMVKLRTLENLTSERYMALNKVDVSLIPTSDALILGKSTARYRIIVFDDPECPYCKKLMPEMKKVVEKRPDIAFLIKMLPLKIHPTAYEKANAIVCAKSLAMLEDSLAGKPVAAPSNCKTDQVDKNIALAQELNIVSVPTLIYPDGMVAPGSAPAETIIQLLDQSKASLPQP